MIQGKLIKKNPRLESKNMAYMSDILREVNKILNPDGPPADWFAPNPDAVAAVHIKDGKYSAELSNSKVMYGGTIVSDKEVKDLKVVAYDGLEGGLYAEGSGTDVTLDGAVISTDGDGTGIGGPASAVAAKYDAKLTVKNAIINTKGRTRYASAVEEGAVLKVYNTVLNAHGIPYGEEIDPPSALMSTPPPPLEIDGNTRCHCSMSNSIAYFYDSTIICDGWAALSTECSEGYVYLEANNCDIICTKSGYGAYSDPGCHDYFNDCKIDTSCMAGIIAGNSDMTFNNCDSKCGSYFILSHCVNGWVEEVGEVTVNGGKIETGKDAILIKSHNAKIEMTDAEIKSETGVILHTILNDDPCKTPVTGDPFGVQVKLTDMDIEGDFIHEDPERPMWIDLESTIIKGAIKGANLTFSRGSKWIATADSTACLMNDIDAPQIDAPAGVTVTLTGGTAGTYDLASGGKLVVVE